MKEQTKQPVFSRAYLRTGALLACLVLTLVLSASCAKTSSNVTYEFTTIRRGSVERTVSSSGTIHPVSSVKVLPQMNGKVEKVFVDYNDQVRRGDILAELNTDVLKLKREQQYAAVTKSRANYELQLINYNSQVALAEKNLISEYELKASRTNLDNMAADLAVAESSLRVIDTEINQYAYIVSPINGVVLDRNINVGDTVVESSTTLFTLAENLRDMQIESNVGELDVASIQRGQEVRFTLESLPGRRFSGVVDNLRMVPVVVSSVVSYTVIISVENMDGSLLPGMTCAVDFIVERSEDVLTISNAALRFEPSTISAERIEEMVFFASLAEMAEEQRQAAIEAREQLTAQSSARQQNQNSGNQGNSLTRLLTGGGQNRQTQQRTTGQGSRANVVVRNLWYMTNDGKLEVTQVRTGISNGTVTELFAPEGLEGMQVILRERL